MEKKQFQQIFRERMKVEGFSSRKGKYYRLLGDDYLVGIYLDHRSYNKAYYIEYGCLYLPDEKRMPFNGWYDWGERCLFARDHGDDVRRHNVQTESYANGLVDFFDYENRTAEEFESEMTYNFENRISRLYNKTFALDFYRNRWIDLAARPADTREKFVRLLHLDRDLINYIADMYPVDDRKIEQIQNLYYAGKITGADLKNIDHILSTNSLSKLRDVTGQV